MRKIIAKWLKEKIEWYRLRYQLIDYLEISKAGRSHSDIRRISTFKGFEAWVCAAQSAFDANSYALVKDCISKAAKTLDNLDTPVRRQLEISVRTIRLEDYRMHVAGLCQ